MTVRTHTERLVVTPRAGAAVAREVLEALDDLPGLAGACVFDVADGTVHAARDAASRPPSSLLSWAAHAREVSAHRSRELEDVIITTTDSHHLLRGLPATGGTAWVYVRVDARRGNLALTRRRLARVATDPEPRTRPTPRAPVRPALEPGPRPAPRPTGRPALPAAAPPAAVPLLAPTTPVRSTPPALAAPAPTRPEPARAAGMPALAMLPPLDESWGMRRPPAPAAPRPTPPSPPPASPTTVDAAPTPEPAPEPAVGRVAIPAPRRVLAQRPRIRLVEPPTVPPPPAPGGEVDEQADPRAPEDDPLVAAMLAEAIALAAADGETADETGDETADGEVAAPVEQPAPDTPDTPGDADGPDGDDGDRGSGEQPDTLPTRTPGEHGAQVPSPRRAPSERSGWGTDGGTLRRLLVGLRRLA